MDNLKAEFQDFMSCMIEDTLLRLKTEDSEYRRHVENKKNSVKKIGEILNKKIQNTEDTWKTRKTA